MSSTRVISQSISPTSTDVKTLRGPFAAKGANDPVILELRNALKKCTPDWLTKLDEKADLTIDRLTQIKESVGFRRSIIESLPAGTGRDKALAELDQAEVTIDEMLTELGGVSAFGTSA